MDTKRRPKKLESEAESFDRLFGFGDFTEEATEEIPNEAEVKETI